MKEILEFAFNSIWTFTGSIIILGLLIHGIDIILKGINSIVKSILGR